MKINKTKSLILGIAVVFGISASFASIAAIPDKFTTRNFTSYPVKLEANGNAAPNSTPPGSPELPGERIVKWWKVKFLCAFKSPCKAKGYMQTPSNPNLLVGEGEIDLNTGVITLSDTTVDGYKINSPEPGVIEIRSVD